MNLLQILKIPESRFQKYRNIQIKSTAFFNFLLIRPVNEVCYYIILPIIYSYKNIIFNHNTYRPCSIYGIIVLIDYTIRNTNNSKKPTFITINTRPFFCIRQVLDKIIRSIEMRRKRIYIFLCWINHINPTIFLPIFNFLETFITFQILYHISYSLKIFLLSESIEDSQL